jgi:hypothetical protein
MTAPRGGGCCKKERRNQFKKKSIVEGKERSKRIE